MDHHYHQDDFRFPSQQDSSRRETSPATSSAPMAAKQQLDVRPHASQLPVQGNLPVQAQMMLMMQQQQQKQQSHLDMSSHHSGSSSHRVQPHQASQDPMHQRLPGMLVAQPSQPQELQGMIPNTSSLPLSQRQLLANHAKGSTNLLIRAPQESLELVPGGPPVLMHLPSNSVHEMVARNETEETYSRYPLHASLTEAHQQDSDHIRKRRATSTIKDPPRPAKSDEPEVMSSMDTASLLHNACKLYPETLAVVESALQMDPGAIRRKIQIVCAKGVDNTSEERTADFYRKRQAVEKYYYPFNIALKHNASIEVLDLLLRAGPDVLAEKDGPDEASSLGIAIELDRSADVIKRILAANPRSARTVDRHANTPLHVLVRTQASNALDVVRLVFRAFPQALKLQNFHRHTPIDVAVRKEVCSEEVVDFLQSQLFDEMEGNAKHLDDIVE